MSSESKWMTRGMAAAALAAMVVAPSFATAQEGEAVAAQPRDIVRGESEEIAPINDGNWTFTLNVDFATEYWFRGISQGDANDNGFIPQVGASAEVLLFEEDEFGISFFMATWNSFTVANTPSNGWYESDLAAGFNFALPANFSASISYVLLFNPSGGAQFAQEIDLSLAYDDSKFMEENNIPITLDPYVLFAFEVAGASDGQGNGSGGYFEVGINPSLVILESKDYPITLSVPVTAGFSLYDYYNFGLGNGDQFFGYLDVGVVLGMPLKMIPEEYGAWQASAGVHFLYLGNNPRKFSGASGTGNESIQVYGIIGVEMTY